MPNAGKGVEKLDLSHIAVGNVESYGHSGRQSSSLLGLNARSPYNTAVALPGIYGRRCVCARKTLHVAVHSCPVCNNPELESTQVSVSRQMVKQTVACPEKLVMSE